MKIINDVTCFAMIVIGLIAMMFKQIELAIYANTLVVALKSIQIAQTVDFLNKKVDKKRGDE
ncbi:hypothetical protein [Streptococcus sanguinis]|jgi:hypothetical protein|uniref:hypothetical protein n=1 Tax=Streptococcus sanguinis TaxID=1305 RepID=UPI001D13F4B8|nr:hypothetical protein [Streptococcus sanguinis]MCC3174002.1 hypothetical protein [Streptococcus sanguinis]